ncbi:formate dehydrogenase accessory sulfurtransferase FdhD [Stakelama tenebrarum]|uniref:Sulfur carrier protein FdhD n=1 Tax=Stakelama tenebrarum TaxID=2711215 RepID=A0A6G6Y4L8_9SPHN|nr:formate dehydrogenase accessory sulfurtransferase FdhD [Sphingosinithalassobacter tenebrarum]QIG79872.1 formate dehydrogenase accessory sulfurtransferase FdhD [Sphingosinithalassobacter tenebrarum]
MNPVAPASFMRIAADGTAEPITRALAAEVPVAIEINGIGYAVMMATPADLEDFATGFLLAERLAERLEDIAEIDTHEAEQGIILRATLTGQGAARVVERVRHRTTDSSCGLCGIDNLEAALRPLPPVAEFTRAEPAAIFAALASLRAHQQLNAETGAVHAAALCAADGRIRLVREDVGRHNGFDKLIGAMARQGLGWDGGFALLSSRCSYELVEKAVLAGCPMLAAISAPTALAVARAREAGLTLAVLARADALLLMHAGAE